MFLTINIHQQYGNPTFQLVEFREKILAVHEDVLVCILTHLQAFFQTGDVSFLIRISFLQLLLN